MKPLVITIFAKAPQPGFAKTRLIPALGEIGAARLAQRLLMHTLTESLAAGVGRVELCVTPSITDPVWQTFAVPHDVQWSDQGGGDLGARMARRAQRAIESGEWKNIVQAYMACVTFVDHYIGAVLDALEKSEHKDNTIVVLWSDHGYRLGEKGTFSKHCLWQEATHAPLIISTPGMAKSAICSRPVEMLRAAWSRDIEPGRSTRKSTIL